MINKIRRFLCRLLLGVNKEQINKAIYRSQEAQAKAKNSNSFQQYKEIKEDIRRLEGEFYRHQHSDNPDHRITQRQRRRIDGLEEKLNEKNHQVDRNTGRVCKLEQEVDKLNKIAEKGLPEGVGFKNKRKEREDE